MFEWAKYKGKGKPAEVLQKINRPEVGLFFCIKLYCKSFWIPPTLHFQLNFSILVSLEILFRFDSDFRFQSERFWIPRGYRFQLEKPINFSCKISLRFWHDFTICSYSVWNDFRWSGRSCCIRWNTYAPHLTRSRGQIDDISTLCFYCIPDFINRLIWHSTRLF